MAKELGDCFSSPNVLDSNLEPANVVDVIDNLAKAVGKVSTAIMPNCVGNEDAAGGRVESLTEAVMGITSGLTNIAHAITDLAEAVRESNA